MEKQHKLKLGIAITTFNRRDLICRQLDCIRDLTDCDFDLVISDDGSSDGTVELLRDRGEFVIAGINRGLAWNKNRGIFALMGILGCDIAILLHDDMGPTERGWQTRWIDAVLRVGHVNLGYDGMDEFTNEIAGCGQTPTLSGTLLGHCMAFHRYPWSMVGYMDTRFKKLGHEHTEFADRFLHVGFGGERQTCGHVQINRYYVTNGVGFYVKDKRDHSESIAENTQVWHKLQTEVHNTYRTPWSTNLERIEFLAEMNLAIKHQEIKIPYPTEKYLSE